MTLKLKLYFLSAIFLILTAYVTWYALTYLKIRRETALSLSSQEFHCLKEKITVGPSHQHNDGPSEIPVEGCGRQGRVLCVTDPEKYSLWSEYFSFDIVCSVEILPERR